MTPAERVADIEQAELGLAWYVDDSDARWMLNIVRAAVAFVEYDKIREPGEGDAGIVRAARLRMELFDAVDAVDEWRGRKP